MRQIEIRHSFESSDRMEMRRSLDHAAAIARQEIVVEMERVNLHDDARRGSDEKQFKFHVFL